MSDQNVILSEEYKIYDMLEHKINQGHRGPLGWVRIFLQTKHGLIYDEGPNLVVAQGREFVAQKVFDSYATLGTPRADWTNYKISHFAIGRGGSTVTGDDVTLNGPYISDERLITPTSLGIEGYLTEPSGTLLCAKSITDGGSLYLEEGTAQSYTKMKCTCVVSSGEPSALGAGETTRIDEAGLYFASGLTAKLFSHICFAPKWKEKESQLTLQWYILF